MYVCICACKKWDFKIEIIERLFPFYRFYLMMDALQVLDLEKQIYETSEAERAKVDAAEIQNKKSKMVRRRGREEKLQLMKIYREKNINLFYEDIEYFLPF